jgi:hypothetical protein
MGFSKLRKKQDSISIIRNTGGADKVRLTKVRGGQVKYSTPLSHKGFYSLEVTTATELVNQARALGKRASTLRVLDIGFGLGYSAQAFLSQGIGSYTSIEINDGLYIDAINEVSNDWSASVFNGDWTVIMQNLANWGYKFDIIYYGMFDEIGDYPNLQLFMDLSASLSDPGTLVSVQGLPLFRGIDLEQYVATNVEMSVPGNVFDNHFTYNLFFTLNNLGYFKVYYQYFDGRRFTLNPLEGGGDLPPCFDCLQIPQ